MILVLSRHKYENSDNFLGAFEEVKFNFEESSDEEIIFKEFETVIEPNKYIYLLVKYSVYETSITYQNFVFNNEKSATDYLNYIRSTDYALLRFKTETLNPSCDILLYYDILNNNKTWQNI